MSTVISYGRDVEESIRRIERTLKRDPKITSMYNTRWLAIKLLEEDEEVIKRLKESSLFNDIIKVSGEERNKLSAKYGDVEVLLADVRYKVIEDIVRRVVRGRKVAYTLSELLDKAILDRILGIPIFLIVLWVMFQFTMLVSAPFCDLVGDFFAWLASQEWLYTGNDMVDSLLFGDYGVINGVGTVLSFTPLIFFLYFALSILEDSGYMARAAFTMDRIMRKLGLTGRTIFSMILGFGCNIPAVYSTRAIPYEEDRLIAILINPLMLCSARLTALALLASTFFGEMAGDIVFSLYLLGILLAIILAKIFRKIIFGGKVSPFILELPDYQKPTFTSVLLHVWWRGSLFFKKALIVIVPGLLLIQVLGSIEYGTFKWVGSQYIESSVLAAIGRLFSPIFSPLGWDWRLVVAAIFGFIAKEIVIGATAMLYGASEEELPNVLRGIYTPLQAYAYMVFILVYVPCIVTIAAIKHEAMSWKWVLFTIAYEVILAYLLALFVMALGSLLGFG
ncbi:MAG: ferrous iron transport protein B [Thermoprotei archaeon]|nr:MAG: ferrous iron transport protein B [Thermoprotei archaeon]